eukprot:2678600-Prymnesium_polylepis.1
MPMLPPPPLPLGSAVASAPTSATDAMVAEVTVTPSVVLAAVRSAASELSDDSTEEAVDADAVAMVTLTRTEADSSCSVMSDTLTPAVAAA